MTHPDVAGEEAHDPPAHPVLGERLDEGEDDDSLSGNSCRRHSTCGGARVARFLVHPKEWWLRV
jgi:hypothetical protein